MRILGIETSCDETAATVVENGTKILSNVVATSAEMHAKTGGVIPEQAARQQVKSIIPVIQEALGTRKLGISKGKLLPSPYSLVPDIDAIAVTVGPGLIGSLLVGVETAKTLAYLWKKPLVPVNHLVAHIYANWLNGQPEFPVLALVVSGGHTDLVLMHDHGNLKWIGGTRDDAAGEAFDKCARILGLPYPGGPAIAAAAANFQFPSSNFQLKLFPRPIIKEDNYDWSFSGLKTAVLRETQKSSFQHPSLASSISPQTSKLAAEVQEAIVDSLVVKTVRAIQKLKPKSFLLAGGVAANRRLREKFADEIKSKKLKCSFHVPDTKLCTDNATYIASCAHFNFKPLPWQKISANPELTIMGEV